MRQRKRRGAARLPASFEVTLNGKRLAVMGMHGRGGINTRLSAWCPRWGRPSISMHLGGTDANDPVWDRFYSWPSPRLRIGDELRIRLVPPTRADEPKFITRYHRLDVNEMPAPENPSFVRIRHVGVWADKRHVLLAASDKGNVPRLTPRTARKVAEALRRAAENVERRRAGE